MNVLFSSENIASRGIASKLMGMGFEGCAQGAWEREGVRMMDTRERSMLDLPIVAGAGPSIVLSTHRSGKEGRMLTAHVPGNWADAMMGGSPRTLNIAHGPMLKSIAIAMKEEADRIGWPFSLEADHHGPTPGKAIIFMEIGNGQGQWEDDEARQAVARALIKALERGPYGQGRELEAALCVGGGHYSREFTKIELEDGSIAVGHIAPKYAVDALDGEMLMQGIGRCVPEASVVLIAKEGVSALQREKVIALCQQAGIAHRLI